MSRIRRRGRRPDSDFAPFQQKLVPAQKFVGHNKTAATQSLHGRRTAVRLPGKCRPKSVDSIVAGSLLPSSCYSLVRFAIRLFDSMQGTIERGNVSPEILAVGALVLVRAS